MLCVGQVFHSVLTVRNQTGAPSSVTLAITKPDGTLVSPAPAPATGTQVGADWVVFYDYTLADKGLHKFAWTTTSPGTAPPPEFVSVRDYISLVSFGEIRDHLNITSATSDDELSAFMMAATELVENKVGPCVRRAYTWRVEQRDSYVLVLPYKPVLSVTSVTSVWSGGPSWATAQLGWDAQAGTVYQVGMMPFWWGPWDVVLSCGRVEIPERFIQACKEQCRHLWDTQRGAAPPSVLQGEEIFTATTGFTFSVPRRVLELLEQDMVPSI